MQSYFDEKMKEKEELEREKRLMTEAKNNVTNWDTVDLWAGRQYTLVEREKYREIVDKANRAFFMESDNVRMKEDIEDWKEAVSRSRNLMNSYKELAERKNPEKNSIEKMAGMTFQVVSNEILNFMKENNLVEQSGEIYFMEKGKARTAYQELSEELKDQFRVMATRIISEDPEKEKSSI